MAGISHSEGTCASFASTARSCSKGSTSGSLPRSVPLTPSRGHRSQETSHLGFDVAFADSSPSEDGASARRRSGSIDGDSLDMLLSQASA
eukprot:CAMPEP_0115513138 /NCGR_PEP_ID=MMETSP0271-20121206/74908_1 /TAXON_ID=71861 /ORGANISM="Scrippsiella trochoidea, Strain CCMP3099" /LENGTH=89 /DNA_ID=CAMNT_0002943393 /DNA_START=194 /DNA_END=463 /DNA_ORIENTATION=-